MSVIGRLDEQVDSVLIAPLDRNRRPVPSARDDSTDELKHPSSDREQTPREADPSQTKRDERQELPVWLL